MASEAGSPWIAVEDFMRKLQESSSPPQDRQLIKILVGKRADELVSQYTSGDLPRRRPIFAQTIVKTDAYVNFLGSFNPNTEMRSTQGWTNNTGVEVRVFPDAVLKAGKDPLRKGESYFSIDLLEGADSKGNEKWQSSPLKCMACPPILPDNTFKLSISQPSTRLSGAISMVLAPTIQSLDETRWLAPPQFFFDLDKGSKSQLGEILKEQLDTNVVALTQQKHKYFGADRLQEKVTALPIQVLPSFTCSVFLRKETRTGQSRLNPC